MKDHLRGRHTAGIGGDILKFEALKCHFLHSARASKFSLKFMSAVLVFKIKEGKKVLKKLKNINNNLSLLSVR